MNDIKVGDLVMVVKPRRCCQATDQCVGRVYGVTGFFNGTHCPRCKTEYGELAALVDNQWLAFPLWRLRKILPLSELEETTTSDHMDIKV